jgi:hypothetical protein
MRWRLAVIVAVLLAGAAQAAELLSKSEFTQEVARTLRISRQHYEGIKITGELAIQYHVPQTPPANLATMYLDNAYDQYRNDPDQLREIIKNHIQATDVTASAVPCTAASILPSVKPKAYMDSVHQLQLQAAAENKNGNQGVYPITQPLVDDLVVIYVIDLPTATEVLDRKHLDKCGVKAEQVQTLALDNLRKKAADFQLKTVPDLPGIYLVQGDNYYETSLPLLDEYWNAQRFPFKGEIVIAIPARGRLLVADGADKQAIDGLAQIARHIFDSAPYNTTPMLYARRGGHWLRYQQ